MSVRNNNYNNNNNNNNDGQGVAGNRYPRTVILFIVPTIRHDRVVRAHARYALKLSTSNFGGETAVGGDRRYK